MMTTPINIVQWPGKLALLTITLFTYSTYAGDPLLTSWLTRYSGQYARVYETDADRTSGTTLTTWPRAGRTVNGGQATPTYVGVHEIASSANWVYVRSSGLAPFVMGPWYTTTAHGALFNNMPKNSAVLFRLPRVPQPAATKTLTGLGPIGIFVDGVIMFDSRDAFSYVASSGMEANPGDGIWNRDAFVNESQTFDPALAHQPGSGMYHYHANPAALRFLLGDNVSQDPVTRLYTENNPATNLHHSPILGWVRDGYPVYGPYGYANATNPASGVRRMISGFALRNTNSPGVLSRTNLPAWAGRAQNRATNLVSSQFGPAVSAARPFGRYLEDNDFLADLGLIQGVDFDLDEYNGRFCATPEFPNGTYAYFTCVSTNGTPLFPYNIGRQIYGVASGGTVANVAEAVTTNFYGGPHSTLQINTPSRNPVSGDVTLTWSSVEGGTYRVDTSTNLSTWVPARTNLASGIATSSTQPGAAQGGSTNRFYKVTRTGLATFDAAGF